MEMSGSLNDIVTNARTGQGPCSGCPAHADTGGQFVNPGLLDYEAELMVLTMDPSHYIDWDAFTEWSDYNATTGERFKNEWRGGTTLRKLLRGIPGVTIDDI